MSPFAPFPWSEDERGYAERLRQQVVVFLFAGVRQVLVNVKADQILTVKEESAN